METEFVYWRHKTAAGVTVEEVTGAEDRSSKVWLQMALQIYCEQGRDAYREIGHFANGAPFLFNEACRISISHADHILVVASLPRTPEADLSHFSERTAMGIDTERLGRDQVLKIRTKFLSDAEMAMTGDDVTLNLVAWTAKEALYKAGMTEGLDIIHDIVIRKLPDAETGEFGSGLLRLPIEESDEKKEIEMDLYSYISEGCVVTIAISPKCAKFTKTR